MSTLQRHVLITGGAGFIGTNLAARLAEDGRRVLVFDSLGRPGVEQNLRWLKATHGDRVRCEIADVRDTQALRSAVAGAEGAFHLAAQVAVTTSLEEPVEDFQVNAQATVALLDELRRLRRPVPMLYTSTNKVYGTLPDVRLERAGERWEPEERHLRERGISELQPLAFCTPYGCSKGAAEQYVLDYARTFGLPAVVFRMSCIYGPHQHGTEDQGWVAHFVLRALSGEPISVYGDGAQVRDLLYVTDLVDAMLRVLEDVDRLAGTPFNVGGGATNTLSVLEVLAMIEELEGEQLETKFAEERKGDQRWYVSDTTRLRQATGWKPLVKAEEGVASLHRWLARDRTRAVAAAAAKAG